MAEDAHEYAELCTLIPHEWRIALRQDTTARQAEQEIWWTNGQGRFERYWTKSTEGSGKPAEKTRMTQEWTQETDSHLLRAKGEPREARTEIGARGKLNECVIIPTSTVESHDASWQGKGDKENNAQGQTDGAYI